MENHVYLNHSHGEGAITTTVIDWDEFRKCVNVGDTIQEPTRTLRVTEKAYELTGSGQHFVVHVYVQ